MNSSYFFKNPDATWSPEHVVSRLREITLLRWFKSKNNSAYIKIYIIFPDTSTILGHSDPASDPDSYVSGHDNYVKNSRAPNIKIAVSGLFQQLSPPFPKIWLWGRGGGLNCKGGGLNSPNRPKYPQKFPRAFGAREKIPFFIIFGRFSWF